MTQRCSTCRFYLPDAGVEPDGTCHRFPPVIQRYEAQHYLALWPVTEDSDWCGEWASNVPERLEDDLPPAPGYQGRG